MLELLSQSTDQCIGFRVSGKLTAEDYGVILPKLDEAIAAHGTINLVVVIQDFHGWASLDAAKADYQMGKTQYRDVTRAAFVSDRKWHGTAVRLLDPFTRHTDERYFEESQLEEAWQWACGN
jgi:hypothetical protein